MTEPIYIKPEALEAPDPVRPDRSRGAHTTSQELEHHLASLRRQQAALQEQDRTRIAGQKQQQVDDAPSHSHTYDRDRHLELD